MSTKNFDIRHNINWHARPVGERPVYDAYGQHPWSADEPTAADLFGAELDFIWQDLTTDPAAKLFDNAPRAFDPAVGQFMQREPLAYVDGLNAYLAEADNPIHAANPLGE